MRKYEKERLEFIRTLNFQSVGVYVIAFDGEIRPVRLSLNKIKSNSNLLISISDQQ